MTENEASKTPNAELDYNSPISEFRDDKSVRAIINTRKHLGLGPVPLLQFLAAAPTAITTDKLVFAVVQEVVHKEELKGDKADYTRTLGQAIEDAVAEEAPVVLEVLKRGTKANATNEQVCFLVSLVISLIKNMDDTQRERVGGVLYLLGLYLRDEEKKKSIS